MVAGEKGYPAPKDREWWRQVRPWLRQLSKILKFVPKLSDLAKAYDEQWYKSIDLSVEIYDAVAEAFPEFAAQTERSARRELDVVMGKEVEAEGAALRALHVFLREVDKTQHWCGLQKRGHQRRQHPVAVRRTCPVPRGLSILALTWRCKILQQLDYGKFIASGTIPVSAKPALPPAQVETVWRNHATRITCDTVSGFHPT